MPILKVVGLDPSLSNLGMIKGDLDTTSGCLSNLEISLIETKPTNKNKTVRKNSQDLIRAKDLFDGMHDFIKDVDLVFTEMPIGSQTARAMASYGVCITLMASIHQPMIQVTPTEIKKTACNKKKATKDEMIKWAINTYPNLPWFTQTQKGVTTITKKNEHVADALGAIYAGVKTDTFKQLLTIYNKTT